MPSALMPAQLPLRQSALRSRIDGVECGTSKRWVGAQWTKEVGDQFTHCRCSRRLEKMKITSATFLASSLAIAGVPPLAGFFSKDEILWLTISGGTAPAWLGQALWAVAFVAAGMTAFYVFRVVFLTFYGEDRVSTEAKAHLHESPFSMTMPLVVLATGAVVVGFLGVPAALGGSNVFHPKCSSPAGAEFASTSQRAIAAPRPPTANRGRRTAPPRRSGSRPGAGGGGSFVAVIFWRFHIDGQNEISVDSLSSLCPIRTIGNHSYLPCSDFIRERRTRPRIERKSL